MYLRVRNRGSEKNASIVRRPVEEPVRPHQRGVQEVTSASNSLPAERALTARNVLGFFFFSTSEVSERTKL